MANQEILDRISHLQASGKTDAEIRADLTAKGYSVQDINGAFAITQLSQAPFAKYARPQSFTLTPQHQAGGALNTLLHFFFIGIIILAAPGVYGLVTNVVFPAAKGQPVAVSDSLKPYGLVQDIPANEKNLIPSGPAPLATNKTTSGSHSGGFSLPFIGTVNEPAPAAPAAPEPTGFSANATSLNPGDQLILTWNIPNAATCDGNLFSAHGQTKGTATFNVNKTATYVLSCHDASHALTLQSLTVTVGEKFRGVDTTGSTDTGGTVAVGGVSTGNSPDQPPVVPVLPDPVPPPPIITPPPSTTTPPTQPSPVPGGILVSSPAELTAALNAAKGGETISLAAGNYGDYTLPAHAYSSPVTIQSVSSSNRATFRTLSINGSSNVTIDNVHIHFTPNSTTVDWQAYLYLQNSTRIAFTNSVITADPAINGEPATATAVDPTGNVIGYPTGYGINIVTSSNITIQGNDMSGMDRGIILGRGSDQITIRNNNIHNTRRTPIAGGASNVIVDGNYLHDVNPWKLGSTPYGDHGDYLAMWTDGTHPITNVQITNNRMELGSGKPVLGMWFQGTSDSVGFSNNVIRNNVFIMDNHQAIMLRYTTDTKVDHNTMIHTPDYWKLSPRIILLTGSKRISATNNIVYEFDDSSGSTGADANTHSGNLYVQRDDATKPGYYDQSVVDQAASMNDPTAIYSYVQGAVKNPGPLVLLRESLLASVGSIWKLLFK